MIDDDNERIIDQIVERHGEVINVRQDPGVLIDIIRRFGPIVADDGGLPGGVPPSPPPTPGPASFSPFGDEPGTPGPTPSPEPAPAPGEPGNPSPGPSGFGVEPTLADVMKVVLELQRNVDRLRESFEVANPGGPLTGGAAGAPVGP